LLENGSCTNVSDFEGVTPLPIAAKEGHWKAVDELLHHDPAILPRVLSRDAECVNTHLHRSSESGDLEALRIILKSCKNIDTTKEIGCTALHGRKEVC